MRQPVAMLRRARLRPTFYRLERTACCYGLQEGIFSLDNELVGVNSPSPSGECLLGNARPVGLPAQHQRHRPGNQATRDDHPFPHQPRRQH